MISEGSPIAGRCVRWESAYDPYAWPPGSAPIENRTTSTHVLRPRKGRAADSIDTARRAGITELPRKTNARRAILRRQTLGRQHRCSLASFWSAAANELVLSRTAVVATSDDSLAKQDTPLLLLSGRTTRLYEYHLVAWSLYRGPPNFIITRWFWKPSVFGVVMLYIYPVDPNLFEKRRQIRF
ncbi:uncharacterized protein LOC113551028 [Rhopalosiphum maidis]|uniref:uncharacterized protein LOC113551028 n=1 Tax=Rhopalosiphum maidis TaxID=43146 RepID=UPI000EFFA278|nr:uncharacterized protein LOC113551028 [Rhopalosiphum maidis]